MRLTKLILVLAALLLLLPGSALAEPQEQLILRQIDVGSFDVWQHTDGTWQDTDNCGKRDYYGWKGKKVSWDSTFPRTQYTSQYTLTRVEVVKMDSSFTMTDEEFASTGRPESWNDFRKKYLRYLPDNYKVGKTGEDLAAGMVTVQRTFDLTPELLDLKDPYIRAELGMTDRDFSDFAQGWRWYLPVLISWYGIAQQPPDFSTQLEVEQFKDVKPGQVITSTVTYSLNKDHPQPEMAWLRLHHVIGENEYPITLEPLDPADAPNTKGYIEFQPGESKTYRYKFTVQNRPSVIVSRINPISVSQDANWENNRDEAPVLVPENDIMVKIRPKMNPWTTNRLPDLVETTVNVKRKDNSGGNLPVKLTVQGPAGSKTFTFNLAPGQYKSNSYNFTASSTGNYSIKAEAWPADSSWTDAYPKDNVDTEVIEVTYYQPPKPTDSRIHGEILDARY